MEDLFGIVTAPMVAATVTTLVQIAKVYFGLEGKKSFALSGALSLLLASSFHLIVSLIEFRDVGFDYGALDLAMVALEALIYSVATWAMALGIYGGAKFLKETYNES